MSGLAAQCFPAASMHTHSISVATTNMLLTSTPGVTFYSLVVAKGMFSELGISKDKTQQKFTSLLHSFNGSQE